VRHNLLRRENSLDGVAAVLAHPQALAQCHAWLSHHLPKAERRAFQISWKMAVGA